MSLYQQNSMPAAKSWYKLYKHHCPCSYHNFVDIFHDEASDIPSLNFLRQSFDDIKLRVQPLFQNLRLNFHPTMSLPFGMLSTDLSIRKLIQHILSNPIFARRASDFRKSLQIGLQPSSLKSERLNFAKFWSSCNEKYHIVLFLWGVLNNNFLCNSNESG